MMCGSFNGDNLENEQNVKNPNKQKKQMEYNINGYYKEILIHARILLGLSALACIAGVGIFIVCINKYCELQALIIKDSNCSTNVSLLVIGTVCGIIMQIVAYIVFGGYRDALQELSAVNDKRIAAEMCILSLKEAETSKNKTEDKDIYEEITEMILMCAKKLFEGTDEKE